ncbi:MAG: SAM-dependent methyltransferase [Acidiferrobacteraceae bacterium]|nr:SAM-dependent methyltransferase [Acidiferrobacteraceae bacterium]|tara:strand:- start:101 stop:934 length:834 start_codon:yes stop_codon:yes gene_type:complete
MTKDPNVDIKTVNGFGDEWSRFDQSELSDQERKTIFEAYFSIFPWHVLPESAKGMDVGCGSGRWAKLVAPKVGILHCIEPSDALKVARKNLSKNINCRFHQASVDSIPIEDSSLDFGYSLGVLHHIPDTQAGIESCVRKLKPGAPLLIYLYYAFDNKPSWFSTLWVMSDLIRKIISRFPYGLRYLVTQLIAFVVYFPMAKLSWVLEKIGVNVDFFPLSVYRKLSFYTMRTDALDRFGTRFERRFTRQQIQNMMKQSGLERIEFSSKLPFWCAVGYRS